MPFKVSAPLVTKEKSGARGELRSGGRVAAVFSTWAYAGTRDGWIVKACFREHDERLIDQGAEYECRLVIGNYVHVAEAVTVKRTPTNRELLAIVGTQQWEKIERYGSGRKNPSEQQSAGALRVARAIRDPTGAGPNWDPSRGRILVRLERDGHAPVRRGPLD